VITPAPGRPFDMCRDRLGRSRTSSIALISPICGLELARTLTGGEEIETSSCSGKPSRLSAPMENERSNRHAELFDAADGIAVANILIRGRRRCLSFRARPPADGSSGIVKNPAAGAYRNSCSTAGWGFLQLKVSMRARSLSPYPRCETGLAAGMRANSSTLKWLIIVY
jgi:hypothetical protein